MSRYFVDARVLSIFEGAEETLALKVIARALFGRRCKHGPPGRPKGEFAPAARSAKGSRVSLAFLDLRVVESSAFIAAPLAGLTLAQFGADVIRVEMIGGGIDYQRLPRDADRPQPVLDRPQQEQALARGGPRSGPKGASWRGMVS